MATQRLVPSEQTKQNIIYDEHLVRYQLASQVVKGKQVLDVACGNGYGSYLLSQAGASKVVGVDVDQTVVAQAQKQYQANNLEYITDSAESLKKIADQSFDVIVSFETIEHLQNYPDYLQALKRVLKPDGLVMISTPNKEAFKNVNNPFHVHEFTKQEFTSALQAVWPKIKLVKQYNALASVIELSAEPVMATITNSAQQSLYFVAICSNLPLEVKLANTASLNAAAFLQLSNNPAVKLVNKIYSILVTMKLISPKE